MFRIWYKYLDNCTALNTKVSLVTCHMWRVTRDKSGQDICHTDTEPGGGGSHGPAHAKDPIRIIQL